MASIWKHIISSIEARPLRWLWITTAGLTLYLLAGVFFGFDVCDNGQYMTFYENIFTAPHSVGYHFMYYLSGLVGGTILSLCPAMGLLGMRFVGLLCFVASMLLVYKTMKGTLPATAIIAGNVLAMTAFMGNPVTFCHDILSILLYLSALCLLWKGSGGCRWWMLLAGGFLLGTNIFARTPNVLGLVFVLSPVVVAISEGKKTGMGRAAVQACVAVAGAVCGIVAVIAVMAMLGHLDIYLNNLAEVRNIAADSSGESSHSLGTLVMVAVNFYVSEAYVWFKLATLICIYTFLYYYFTKPYVRIVVLAVGVAASFYMMWRMLSMQPLWALCAAGCLTLMVTGKGKERALALIAFLLMIIFPLGSDNAYNNGSIIAMLAAPVAVAACMKHTRYMRVAPYLVAFVVCNIGHLAVNGAYFDHGPLWNKTSPVGNLRTTGVYTTSERSAIVNSMLSGIEPYVHAGDTLMVYGSFPMINYLTSTRPAMDCCWPELLGATMLENRLRELDSTQPLVLRQLFNSIGEEFSAPSKQFLYTYGDEKNEFLYDRKIELLNDFLRRNNYKEIYRNSHFILYQTTHAR